MAYFPFFMELAGRSGLIVGGGTVALRKTEKLLPFGAVLTVAAPAVLPAFYGLLGVKILQSKFALHYLENIDFVIAATDDFACNHDIAMLCRQRGIPVNSATDLEDCTFLFPALVQRGEVTVGISTGGASPAVAAYLREQLEGLLPERLEEILDALEALRQELKTCEMDSGARRRILTAVTAAAMAAGRPLTTDEVETMWKRSGGAI